VRGDEGGGKSGVEGREEGRGKEGILSIKLRGDTHHCLV